MKITKAKLQQIIKEAIEEEMMDYLVLSELTEDAPSKGCLIYPILIFLLWNLA